MSEIKLTINGRLCTGEQGETILTVAARNGIAATARMPIDPAIAAACDNGAIEMVEAPWLEGMANLLEEL